MKRILLSLFAVMLMQLANATTYNVTIVGTTYSPANISAQVGDTVNIQASGNHPLVQVDSTTWMANANTPMVGGWGIKNTTYQVVVTSPGVIYFVCQIHAGMGMKGKIVVTTGPTGLSEVAITTPEVKVYPTYVNDGGFTVLLSNTNIDAPVLNLYNMAGQLAEKHTLGKTQNAINTNLPAGMYIYTVGNAANSKVLKTGKLIIVN